MCFRLSEARWIRSMEVDVKTMTRKYVPCGACGKRCPKRRKDRWFANEGQPAFLVEVSKNGLCVDCESHAKRGVSSLRQSLLGVIESDEDEWAVRYCFVLAWLERRARQIGRAHV